MLIPGDSFIPLEAVEILKTTALELPETTFKAGAFYYLSKDFRRFISSISPSDPIVWQQVCEYLSRAQNTEFYNDPDYRPEIEGIIIRCIQNIRLLLLSDGPKLKPKEPFKKEMEALHRFIIESAHRGEPLFGSQMKQYFSDYPDFDIVGRFTEIYGCSPDDYYTRMRLEYAYELVRHGIDRRTVARKLGFKNLASMSGRLRSFSQVSPRS